MQEVSLRAVNLDRLCRHEGEPQALWKAYSRLGTAACTSGVLVCQECIGATVAGSNGCSNQWNIMLEDTTADVALLRLAVHLYCQIMAPQGVEGLGSVHSLGKPIYAQTVMFGIQSAMNAQRREVVL
jgi:hypothetical protein